MSLAHILPGFKMPRLGPPRLPSPRIWRRVAIVVLVALALCAAGLLAGRLALLTPLGRAFVASLLDGRATGRLGTLRLYGLRGDVLHAVTVDRATLADSKGVWLEARDLRLTWSPVALLGRRFHAQVLEAARITVLRRPDLAPATGPPEPMPVSVQIDRFGATVELMADFSKEYGRWAASGDLDLDRIGRKRARLTARSLTRPGDHLDLDLDAGGRDRLKIAVEGVEAQGGPLAGALGYAPGQPFILKVEGLGTGGQGRLDAVLTSGAVAPLTAQARWSAAGATAQGRLVLAGSDLLKPLADRLGPMAQLTFDGHPAPGGQWRIKGQIQADNLLARIDGAIDPKTRAAPRGVGLSLAIASAGRLVGPSVTGAARFDGVWRGDVTNGRLSGTLALRQARLGGYGLTAATGPIDLSLQHGRLDATLRLQGSGGSGAGMIAGLLGPRPSARLDISRLAPGSLLLRRLDVDGQGLVVRAQGARSLTGALEVHGQADIAKAAILHPGAQGALTAHWRAAQAGARKPWSLDLDAQGHGFASGLAQLDRLLGAEPRLTGAGRFDRQGLKLDRAALNGKALVAKGQGTVALTGALDLKLDWTARGPFQIGPVELAGDARGSGAIGGKLTAPHADLTTRFAEIDLPALTLRDADLTLSFARDPAGYDGAASLKAASAYGQAAAATRFAFVAGGVRLDQLSLDAAGVKAHGALVLTRGAPSSADLAFTAGPGAFLASGTAQGTVHLTDTSGTGAAIDVAGSGLALKGSSWTLNRLKLDGQGSLAHLPFTLSADVGGPAPVTFTGTGVYARSGAGQTVQLSGAGQTRGVAFHTLQPVTLALAGADRAFQAALAVGGGRLDAQGRQTGEAIDLHAKLAGGDLGLAGQRLAGRVDADLTLTGRGERLAGTLDAKLAAVKNLDAPKTGAVDGTIKASLAGDRLRLDASAIDTSGGRASASGELSVVASANPLRLAIARTQPLSGRFSIQGEAKPYWDLFQGGEQSLSGQVAAQGTISGTLDAPAVAGSATLAKAAFEDAGTGLRLREMNVSARFDRDAARIDQFTAVDGLGGSLAGQGRIDLAKGAASTFTLTLTRFRVVNNDLLNARASGALTVNRGGDGKVRLAGALKVDRAEIAAKTPTPSGVVRLDVIELHRPEGPTRSFVPRASGPAVALDISLDAPGQILVSGRGLSAELSLKAHVGGSSQAPELTGQAYLLRGAFTFAGKRFDFDPSGAIALSSHLADIRLDLRAVYDQPSLTATVKVTGTAGHPDITFASVPALPQDEILSQILFGSSASQLNGAQAAQLGAATAALAGGGGFDIFGNLRAFAGLDVLTFGSDTSGLSVAGGKYIGNRLYLEVVGGGQGGAAARVEWRPLKSLSIVSQLAGAGYSKIAVRWRKDFK